VPNVHDAAQFNDGYGGIRCEGYSKRDRRESKKSQKQKENNPIGRLWFEIRVKKKEREGKEIQGNKHMAKGMSIRPGNMRQGAIGPKDYQK
jgi:hypothetical protein